jgi:hypothetical protein
LRVRDQFKEDFQSLFRRERQVVFSVCPVGFGKGAKDAGDFFHRRSLPDVPRIAQTIFTALDLHPLLHPGQLGSGLDG